QQKSYRKTSSSRELLLLWLFFWDFAGRNVCRSFSHLRRRDFLFVLHAEQPGVAETVPPMDALPSPVVIHFRALRQPHTHIALAEFYGAIFDRGVIGQQSDLRHRRNQIRLESHDL